MLEQDAARGRRQRCLGDRGARHDQIGDRVGVDHRLGIVARGIGEDREAVAERIGYLTLDTLIQRAADVGEDRPQPLA